MAVFKMRSPFPRRLTAALYCFFLVLMSIKGQDDNWCTYSNWEEVKKKNTFFGGLVTHQHVVEASRGVSNPMARAFQIIKINEEESQPIAHPFVCPPLNKVTTSRPFFFPFPPESFDVYYLYMGWRNTRPCRKRNFPNDIFKYLHRIDFYKIQQTRAIFKHTFPYYFLPRNTPKKNKKKVAVLLATVLVVLDAAPYKRQYYPQRAGYYPTSAYYGPAGFSADDYYSAPYSGYPSYYSGYNRNQQYNSRPSSYRYPSSLGYQSAYLNGFGWPRWSSFPRFVATPQSVRTQTFLSFLFDFFFFFNFEAILDRCQMMSCEHVQLNHTIEWCRSLWPTWTMGGGNGHSNVGWHFLHFFLIAQG